VRWNMVMPGIDVRYVENVMQNRDRGGSILLMHTGLADVQWLQDNIDTLVRFTGADGVHYHITDISESLND